MYINSKGLLVAIILFTLIALAIEDFSKRSTSIEFNKACIEKNGQVYILMDGNPLCLSKEGQVLK